MALRLFDHILCILNRPVNIVEKTTKLCLLFLLVFFDKLFMVLKQKFKQNGNLEPPSNEKPEEDLSSICLSWVCGTGRLLNTYT